MRDRGATRALVLGLLALWFGIFAPFAIFSATRSLLRIRASNGELRGAASATTGLVAGVIGIAVIVAGVGYWILAA
ncbi:MAG TPA: hypothetical protein VG364_03490 [Candidatus Dormibacteraeota bacterium]|jgi:hypothetical protein|nr:hypothetical protein [Candidatus Dormibacteraeota bacterium]